MSEQTTLIPKYWLETVDKKIAEIKNAKKDIGENTASFAFITDFHLIVNEKHSAPIIKKVIEECDIPYLINAGDIVSGVGNCSEEFLLDEITQVLNLFKDIEDKCIYAEGNHDRAFCTFPPPDYYRENLTKKVFHDKFFLPQKKHGDRIFGDGGYFYIDDKVGKVRYIVLNSQDVPSEEKTEKGFAKYNVMTHFGFLQNQIDWLAAVALNLPSDEWHVVVCSHATATGIAVEEHVYNYDLVLGILDAFNRKSTFSASEEHENCLFNASTSVDFSDSFGKIIAWVGGHTHRDNIAIKKGIVQIESMSDSAYTELNPKRKNTTDEQVIDVFIIDKETKKVKVIRIGRGENREFSY